MTPPIASRPDVSSTDDQDVLRLVRSALRLEPPRVLFSHTVQPGEKGKAR